MDEYRSMGSGSNLTTVPNTPEPPPIESVNEPSGDFARLYPVSYAARLAFHDVVLAIRGDPVRYRHHERFVHVYNDMDCLDDVADCSTSDESSFSSRSKESVMVHAGFWRLNLNISPGIPHLGWVLGRGRRWDRVGSWGDVDLWLSTTTNSKSPLRARHARLLHNLVSNSFLIIPEKQLAFQGEFVSFGNQRVCGQLKNNIAFGDLAYCLQYTDLDQDLYRGQLDQLAKKLQFNGPRPAGFELPTPQTTDFSIGDSKYTVKASFAIGSTCFICSAIDNTGAQFVVKRIVVTRSTMLTNAHQEIQTMKRLLSLNDGEYPPSLLRFVEDFTHNASTQQGATEIFIISQPLISTTLFSLLEDDKLPMSARLEFIRQLLGGLAFLHGHGCMHRDIKPSNIVARMSPKPEAVLVDFGVVCWSPTSTDHRVGTIRYLAPEVLDLKAERTSKPYNNLVDVWALGLTFFELLSGIALGWKEMTHFVYTRDLNCGRVPKSHAYKTDTNADWANSLVQDMMVWDPSQRISVQKALSRIPQCPLIVAEESTSGKRGGSPSQGEGKGKKPREQM